MSVWDVNTQQEEKLTAGTFRLFTRDPDLQGLLWVLDSLQQRATASTHILYSYGEIMNQVNGLPTRTDAQQLVQSDSSASGGPAA